MCWFSRMFGRVGWNGLTFGVIARGLSASVWSFPQATGFAGVGKRADEGGSEDSGCDTRRSLVTAFSFPMLLKMPHLSTLKAKSFFMCMSVNILGGY